MYVETPRLLLRPLVANDSSALSEIGNDRRVADSVLSIPVPFPNSAARTWIDRGIANQHAVSLAVLVRQDSLLVGSINLALEPDHEQAELGFWFGVTFWNRGYATESALALLGYAFDELALNRVHAHHMLRNRASGAVLRKIGMQSEGVLRQRIKKNGTFEDVAIYAVLRSEFPADKKTRRT